MTMRQITGYVALACALFLAGLAAGGQLGTHDAVIHGPASCTAPLNDGTFKSVPDGDAERYDTGVYVCANGLWIAAPDYGQ